MTQEEKSLLLKDLSARLSYGIICQVDDGAAGLNDGKLVEIDISKELVRFDADYYWDAWIDDIKPYLRPMSYMTEEEEYEYHQYKNNNNLEIFNQEHHEIIKATALVFSNAIDWLLAHHFDFRGLIEKGLAIEVTKENNPYEN